MNAQQAKQQAREAIARAQDEVNKALTIVKAQIGDQDGDGDVDFTDARLRATKAVGGVSKREAIFLAVGVFGGFVLAKVAPFVARLLG
jgi:hypothetical protein